MTYSGVADLIEELKSRSALIVHFSHHGNMREAGMFPNDLQDTIQNVENWTLSCCVVWPDHKMSLPGSVGVVLRPRSLGSIVSVREIDSGSSTQENGEDWGFGLPLTRESFAGSFAVPAGEYNEWRVRDFDVVAVYVDGKPLGKKRSVTMINDVPLDTIAPVPVSFEELSGAFPGLPVIVRVGQEYVNVATFVHPY